MHTSKTLDCQRLATDLQSDPAQNIQWAKNWLVIFNPTKAKPVTFHHHRSKPELRRILMNVGPLGVSPFLEKPWGLKPITDLNWNTHVQYISKDAFKIFRSIYHYSKYQTPAAILYVYKSSTRSRNRREHLILQS